MKVGKQGGVFADDADPEPRKGGRDCGSAEGKRKALHLGRPGRKRGGRVGAELSPLSSAAKSCD